MNINKQRSEERKFKINMISADIANTFKLGKEVDKEKVLAHYSLKFGASRRTILDYLKMCQFILKYTEVNGIIKKRGRLTN